MCCAKVRRLLSRALAKVFQRQRTKPRWNLPLIGFGTTGELSQKAPDSEDCSRQGPTAKKTNSRQNHQTNVVPTAAQASTNVTLSNEAVFHGLHGNDAGHVSMVCPGFRWSNTCTYLAFESSFRSKAESEMIMDESFA